MRFLAGAPVRAAHVGRTTLAAVLALVLAGCSSKQAAHEPPQMVRGPQPPAVAQSAYVPEPGDPIKEAPTEPVRRATPEPDDPSEPFSRNYGSIRHGQPKPAPARVSSLTKPVDN